MWPKLAIVINSRWRRPPFWVPFIAHNSLVIACIRTEFGIWTHFIVLRTKMISIMSSLASHSAFSRFHWPTLSSADTCDFNRHFQFVCQNKISLSRKMCQSSLSLFDSAASTFITNYTVHLFLFLRFLFFDNLRMYFSSIFTLLLDRKQFFFAVRCARRLMTTCMLKMDAIRNADNSDFL